MCSRPSAVKTNKKSIYILYSSLSGLRWTKRALAILHGSHQRATMPQVCNKSESSIWLCSSMSSHITHLCTLHLKVKLETLMQCRRQFALLAACGYMWQSYMLHLQVACVHLRADMSVAVMFTVSQLFFRIWLHISHANGYQAWCLVHHFGMSFVLTLLLCLMLCTCISRYGDAWYEEAVTAAIHGCTCWKAYAGSNGHEQQQQVYQAIAFCILSLSLYFCFRMPSSSSSTPPFLCLSYSGFLLFLPPFSDGEPLLSLFLLFFVLCASCLPSTL